tara:strand:+ start:41 stop:772 length:732 start_codon:yes stop_codon:yes gene_type:complete
MINNKEKGFALVMSLVLLMVMTLMGGALIVIAASDHRSNNIGDEYQQTFYVAETALYEGEKYLLNQFNGPYDPTTGKRILTKKGLPIAFDKKYTPNTEMQDCFYSFPDIDDEFFKLILGPSPDTPSKDPKKEVFYSKSFFSLLSGKNNDGKKIIGDPIDADNDTNLNKVKLKKIEVERLKKFKYQYFIHRVGSAPYKGYGSSIKKGASDSGSDGMAYRIYGCGNYDDGEIIVALESTMVLPSN